MTRRRIKLAIIGSAGISVKAAERLALALFSELEPKYELRCLVTIKQDALGKQIRALAKERGVARKTYSETRHIEHADPDELVAGDVFWEARNFILVHAGKHSWAYHLGQMLNRHGRKYRLLEINK